MYKILLLEDEYEIGQNLQYILQREEYKADHFMTGEEAVDAALEKDYDLMILDIMLQRSSQTSITNGLEVARKITQHKDVPYIMLTARSESYDIMTGLDMGAEDYIPKPYDVTELLARIRAVLRRVARNKSNDTPVELVVGRLKVKLLSHKVYLDGIEVKVTNQQFDLLCYMMQHKNEVLTREGIYKNVWGYDPSEGMGTNTLEVNIKRLRKVIGNDSITTVRGKGYVLEDKY